MLARREHAARELALKLERRGFASEAVEHELDCLAREGLQSDERFTDLFVEQRVGRGDGPLKLRAALTERGIDADRIERALMPYEDEWTPLAREALARRFGVSAAGTRSEQARRVRFLQGRGFPASAVRRATGYDQD